MTDTNVRESKEQASRSIAFMVGLTCTILNLVYGLVLLFAASDD